MLQEAIDTCDDAGGDIKNCAALSLYNDTMTEGCLLEPSIDEKLTGWLDALPGCNPVQDGPGDAKSPSACNAPKAIDKPQHYYTDVTDELGWAWIGCARDDVSSDSGDGQRVLSESSSSSDEMTVQKCIRTCKADGYSHAGVEFGRECYCGNGVEAARRPAIALMGKCLSPCSGDSGQMCGGAAYVGLYRACGSGSGSGTDAGDGDGSCENLEYPAVPQ